ncbi:hypothetical protein B0H66DRAFT_41775 [Apodospora peruviana]|uniref:Transmembrane protein n=1 Tax=Apodospora peruviana TaxID=516989 RepID=A0AAE0IRM7_9PEZI|nr:hypothetical protein B0H66DRAFT_41775 [Apodospora peruviana]
MSIHAGMRSRKVQLLQYPFWSSLQPNSPPSIRHTKQQNQHTVLTGPQFSAVFLGVFCLFVCLLPSFLRTTAAQSLPCAFDVKGCRSGASAKKPVSPNRGPYKGSIHIRFYLVDLFIFWRTKPGSGYLLMLTNAFASAPLRDGEEAVIRRAAINEERE